MFNTKNVVESTGSKYIRPGINENVIVSSVTGVAVEGKAPYLEFAFHLKESTPENATRIKLFMSEGAKSRSMEKLVHIATKITTREKVDAISADTVEGYAIALDALISNK